MATEICMKYNRVSGCTWKDKEGESALADVCVAFAFPLSTQR